MKTTLFIGLLLMGLFFSACDQEREREISVPDLEPLEANAWSDLEAADTQIEIHDHIRPEGSIAYGLNHLEVQDPDRGRPRFYQYEEVGTFFEQYSTEVFNQPETEIPNTSEPEFPNKKEPEGDGDNFYRSYGDCAGNNCQKTVREEIIRLQKIARDNCLCMAASLSCCQYGDTKEIMVYLTPGVQCEKASESQSKIARSLTETH